MITVDGLSFGYRRDEVIIDDLAWRFPNGQVTGVTGASGCGKSTLLYLIGLLLTPWSGEVVFNGTPLAKLSDWKKSGFRSASVGFVFQDAALDSTRSVLDNITESSLYNKMSRREATKRALSLMDRYDVGLRASHKPGEVSGGQAQRIALCRALVSEPAVILADEPTGNLDAATAQVVIDGLQEVARDENRTVIIATHDQAIVDVCDEVLRL